MEKEYYISLEYMKRKQNYISLGYNLENEHYYYSGYFANGSASSSGFLSQNLTDRYIHLDDSLEELSKEFKDLNFVLRPYAPRGRRREATQEELETFKETLESRFKDIQFKIED